MTDEAGDVVAVVELDPWGGETDRCVNQWEQPYRYTTYERDGDGVDQALMRSYQGGDAVQRAGSMGWELWPDGSTIVQSIQLL